MNRERRHSASEGPRSADFARLALTATVWSSSFAFIKLAVVGLPPATLVAVRLMLTALPLLIFLHAIGERLPRSWATWRILLVLGAIGYATPFTLVAWSEVRIDSGLAALIMGVTPAVTLLIAHHFAHGEKMTWRKFLGLGMGFLGLVVLVGPTALAGLGGEATAQIAAALAAVFYAATTVYARRQHLHLSPNVIAVGTVLSGAAWILPVSLIFDRPWTLSPSETAIQSAILLAFVPTATGTILQFRLIARTSATFAAGVNYLVPVLGFVLGAVFLGESPKPNTLAALVLIVASIIVTNWRRRAPASLVPPAGGESG